jgi:hypothetical protein
LLDHHLHLAIRQVGTNCGCIGQHAMVYAQGAVFWMGDMVEDFFAFDGTVKQIPSLVEDFVFTSIGDNLGINFTNVNRCLQDTIVYLQKLIGSIHKRLQRK